MRFLKTADLCSIDPNVGIRFESQGSFARLFAGETITSTCTLMHENASIYLE